MPGWIASPRFLKSHITAPHDRAANTEKYRASGGTGRITAASVVCDVGVDDPEYEVVLARGRNDANTRETT